MSADHSQVHGKAEILQGALISGGINAVINGAIQFLLLRGHAPIPVSANEISGVTHTVFGSAVPLAVSLAMILTAVAHLMLKGPKRPFYPQVVWLMIKHGLFAFGAVVSLAILWQRLAGTVEVGLMPAVVLLGLIAGVVAAVVNYMTMLSSLAPAGQVQ